MRLWTLHPKYLDAAGLVALWREGLLAQKVLLNETKGYRAHPQLARFRQRQDSLALIAAYLNGVCEEATSRGYEFDRTKIQTLQSRQKLTCTRGQLLYEWHHLRSKLEVRSPDKLAAMDVVRRPSAHPMFTIVAGEIEHWERVPA
ncbi:MAG: pyrimidine dimer DNA glycosylase/endonuclease V [bacterium]